MSEFPMLLSAGLLLLLSLIVKNRADQKVLTKFRIYFISQCLKQANEQFGTDFEAPSVLGKPFYPVSTCLNRHTHRLYYNTLTASEQKRRFKIASEDCMQALLLIKREDGSVDCYGKGISTDYRRLCSFTGQKLAEMPAAVHEDPQKFRDHSDTAAFLAGDYMNPGFFKPFESGDLFCSRCGN